MSPHFLSLSSSSKLAPVLSMAGLGTSAAATGAGTSAFLGGPRHQLCCGCLGIHMSTDPVGMGKE